MNAWMKSLLHKEVFPMWTVRVARGAGRLAALFVEFRYEVICALLLGAIFVCYVLSYMGRQL